MRAACISLLLFAYRCVFKFILFAGSPYFSKDLKHILDNPSHQKFVVVFPHSSKWESFWYIVYHASRGTKACALCYHEFFQKPVLGAWLRFTGMISVHPARYGGAQSSTQQVIDMLNDPKRYPNGFMFMISPQGGINADSWKSGYYAIAKGTNAKMIIFGVDYSVHAASYIDRVFEVVRTKQIKTLLEEEKYKNSRLTFESYASSFVRDKLHMDSKLMLHMQDIVAARPDAITPPSRFLPTGPNSRVKPLPIDIAWISYIVLCFAYFFTGEPFSWIVCVCLILYGRILHTTHLFYILQHQMALRLHFQSKYTVCKCRNFDAECTLRNYLAPSFLDLLYIFFAVMQAYLHMNHIMNVCLMGLLIFEPKFFDFGFSFTAYCQVHFFFHLFVITFACYSYSGIIIMGIIQFIVYQNQ